jgi:hypothetical protein
MDAMYKFYFFPTHSSLYNQVQYVIPLKARIGRWLRSGRSPKTTRASVNDPSSLEDSSDGRFMTWILNVTRGLPTSEDLRKTYFWESRRIGANESKSMSVAKRKSRMQRLWKVQWHGDVRMLLQNTKAIGSEWRTVFVLVQGHRLLWWRSIHDFDNGVPPIGQLFLTGHAGLSSPSPLELREIKAVDMDHVICIFGSGSRATMLAPSVDAKEELEQAIESALMKKHD